MASPSFGETRGQSSIEVRPSQEPSQFDHESSVSSPPKPSARRRLHPLPKGLVELYGLIAVLVVLIPEWIADGTINLGERGAKAPLPMTSRAWRTLPELQLASMAMRELRELSRELRIWGYAGDSRERLTARLLTRIHRRIKTVDAL
tara:strand:- start:31 stop:471 length:441 start_codon:yes stop_codon:yes gene_type:complete